jgi:hypothetical protein
MREQLPMNYFDLLKRVAIPVGTIMVLSSALAQEQLTKADLVQLAVTLGVYDNRCENLAPTGRSHALPRAGLSSMAAWKPRRRRYG